MRERIGRFRVLRKLGEGGMGAVFAAQDEKLDREIAIKVIPGSADAEIRERILREARAAARVNHPHVCQIYEIGEDAGEPFIAMEILEGEPLGSRIAKGPLPPKEALRIAAEVLEALDALHRKEVIHRDLKPANIFLTPHGTKVLDFGLARPGYEAGDQTEVQLTRPGTLMGTPRYMAPEQWEGKPAGPAADLFAVGAILFEMLTAKPAFEGATLPEICRAVLTSKPPALAGTGPVAAADRIITRALQKDPADRYPSAATMSAEVRGAVDLIDTGRIMAVRPLTRLIILPFRMLRPDPELDFLAFSLPDAIAASLHGLESLVVRSTLAASRFASDNPDLKRIATEAEVDAVLTGTMLKSADKLRVNVQLVEAPSGTLRASKVTQVSMKELFQLEDELVREIVRALSIPLSPRENSMLRRDVPANPTAYEFYLRANQMPVSTASMSMLVGARDLYTASVQADPDYAPAWARLGRICRIMAKYGHGDVEANYQRAEEAFRTAFRLNPDLPLAHNLYTNFEIEELGRGKEAMSRLLERAKSGAADPNLFAGLSMALRYCGLMDASIAADERARRLDPSIRTGIQYALWFAKRYEEAAERDLDDPPFIKVYSYLRLDRREPAIQLLREIMSRNIEGVERKIFGALLHGIENGWETAGPLVLAMLGHHFRDPEGIFFQAFFLARTGDDAEAVAGFKRTVESGFCCVDALRTEPWLESLRKRPDFQDVIATAERRRSEAVAEFVKAGGPEFLGVARP